MNDPEIILRVSRAWRAFATHAAQLQPGRTLLQFIVQAVEQQADREATARGEHTRKRLRHLPIEERADFRDWLALNGHHRPTLADTPDTEQDGYLESDYRAWKKAHGTSRQNR